MNYEDFLLELQTTLKDMGDLTRGLQTSYKSIRKNLEEGDLKKCAKDTDTMQTLCSDCAAALATIQETAAGFDANAYVNSGDFARQIVDECNREDMDIQGVFPNYEIFPFTVKIDAESLDTTVDRKKIQSLRPLALVDAIKRNRDKLMKASFNVTSFLKELALAYDLTLLRQNAGKHYAKDSDCYLTSIYNTMTPTRFRKDYNRNNFAFDLARLYASELPALADGRKLQFGSSRNIRSAIRILDANGDQQFLSTIRFYI